MYKVYILYSITYRKIYIGFTADIENRMLSHNHLANKGWTVKFRPWALVHTENFETKTQALAREKQLKSAKGREWIYQEIISRL